MRAFVITIAGHAQSEGAAARCVESGERFGVEVETFRAHVPDDPCPFPLEGFETSRPYSRMEPVVAAFMSHAAVWKRCYQLGEPVIVLEHDAVFVAPVPNLAGLGIVNLGAPSYGAAVTPAVGIGPLVSKPHLPGAHAYYVEPEAADIMLDVARTQACATDVFLSLDRFPYLRELYPWPVECHETFTTIQAPGGCKAKHRPVEIL